MGALDTYNTRTRRLLTDPNKQYWQDPELNDDINQARNRVASDTKCLRTLFTGVALTAGQEQYTITTLLNTAVAPVLQGTFVVEVISATVYWGPTQRIKCVNRAFTEQDAKFRAWSTWQTRPGSLAMYGANSCFLNPVPDQNYISDWDCCVTPAALQTSADVEVLPVVFQPLVPYFAAHIAKYGEQSLDESDIFYKKYLTERQAASWAFMGSRFRNPYKR